MEPFQIFALFTWNCRTVIFPSKVSNNITCKPMLAISACNFPLFFQVSNQLSVHATTHLLYKNLDGHNVNLLPFKFSTILVKNLTSILMIKFLFHQYRAKLGRSITEWPAHQTYNPQNSCVRSILENQNHSGSIKSFILGTEATWRRITTLLWPIRKI